MTEPFRYLLRVRYGECDAQMVVFNARYAEYVDIAVNELMRAMWGDYTDLVKRDIDLHVVRYEIDWRAPARFDEVLSVAVQCEHVGRTSFRFACTFSRHGEDEILATAKIVYVVFRPSTGEKQAVPPELRAQLEAGAPGQLVDHAGVLLAAKDRA